MILSKTTLLILTLGIMAFGIMILSVRAIVIMTLGII
jgi:hypothetical protein